MMIRAMRSAAVAALGITLGLAVGIAQADITIERSTAVEGVGAMALANMTGTSRTIISGDNSRTDTETRMSSKLVGFLARNAAGPSAEIILLDQDKLYHLNINKKEYTETTFEQMHAQMQKVSEQMNSNEAKQQPSQQPSAVDQSKCTWLPPKASVNRTGEKAQFAGYDSERVTITASQPCQDKETGSICEVALVLDQWVAPGFTESAEVRKFYSSYAKKMGMDPSSSEDVSQRAKLMFSQYKGIWTEVASKMQNVKGYPVKSSFTLALGGAQCKDSNAQQSQSSQSQTNQTPSGQSDDSPSSPAGVAGLVAGKLGGFFHKNNTDAPASQPAPAAQPAPAVTPVVVPEGDVALMTVSSQLISVSTSAANADAFTVPAGFKKLELKTQ
jgi:hypothetical protein